MDNLNAATTLNKSIGTDKTENKNRSNQWAQIEGFLEPWFKKINHTKCIIMENDFDTTY